MKFEDLRYMKFIKTFDGNIGSGAEDSTTDLSANYFTTIDKDEFIYEVFYRVTSPLNASPTVYVMFGIQTDAESAILDNTTGILDTMNSNSTGVKFNPSDYTKCSIDGRELLMVPKAGDITQGTIEVVVGVGRFNVDNTAVANSITDELDDGDDDLIPE